jgi:hypothetical protein
LSITYLKIAYFLRKWLHALFLPPKLPRWEEALRATFADSSVFTLSTSGGGLGWGSMIFAVY